LFDASILIIGSSTATGGDYQYGWITVKIIIVQEKDAEKVTFLLLPQQLHSLALVAVSLLDQ